MSDPVFTKDFVGEQWRDWDRLLAPFKGQPCRGLEVGSFEGRSSIWFHDNLCGHEDASLHCVDTWQAGDDLPEAKGNELFDRFKANVAGRDKLFWMRMPSCEALPHLFVNGFRYHWAYIDGSHRKAAVLSDCVMVWHLMQPGGVVICDDYEWPMVPDDRPGLAIDAFLACFGRKVEVVHRGYQLAFRVVK